MVIFEVPSSPAFELSEFVRCVVGSFGVYTFGDVFVFDLRRLPPSGIIGLRALDHPAGSRRSMSIFLTLQVDVVVVGVPRRYRVVFVIFPRVTPWGVSAAGRRFLLFVFRESRICWVTKVLGELFVVRFHCDRTGCVSGVWVGAVER